MKNILLLTIPFLFTSSLNAEPATTNTAAAEVTKEAKVVKAAPLRHVVMFKFKDGTTKEQIAVIEKAFGELPKKIKTITGYEWGPNVSKENKNQGFTHCFIVSFADQKGLDVYGPHADHQAFVKILLPILDKVLVLDFVAQ